MSDAIPPYGESFQHGNDPRNQRVAAGYARDFVRQLQAHRLPVPEMNLFPSASAPGNARYYAQRERPGRDSALVIGASFAEAAVMLLGRIAIADVQAARIGAAIHELAHHVSEETGAVHEVMEAQFNYPLHVDRYGGVYALNMTKTQENILERLSDGAMAYYMLSNFKGDAESMLDGFVAGRATDISVKYNTASTLFGVMERFIENPRRGLDLVQCVEVTKQVMAAQDIELEQLRVVHIRSLMLESGDVAQDVKDRFRPVVFSRLSEGVQREILEDLSVRNARFVAGPLRRREGGYIIRQHEPRVQLS